MCADTENTEGSEGGSSKSGRECALSTSDVKRIAAEVVTMLKSNPVAGSSKALRWTQGQKVGLGITRPAPTS